MARPATARIDQLSTLGLTVLSVPAPLAATMVGRSTEEFLELVRKGFYPPCNKDGGSIPVWSIEGLTQAVRKHAGLLEQKPIDYTAVINSRLDASQDQISRPTPKQRR